MKDKIKQFANGIFSYEQSRIILSQAEISLNVPAGKSVSGFFLVTNRFEQVMKGMLYSSHSCFQLKDDCFSGQENKIEYHFNAEFLDAGEVIQGRVDIVSDCGESFLDFRITVEAPFCDTQYEKIKDIFQLMNLARDNWIEAKKIFQSEEFRKVLLYYDKKQRVHYDQIKKSTSGSHALEEFLVASGKKKRIRIQAEKEFLEYDDIKEEIFYDKLVITKKGWGYAEIKISTEATFITLDRKLIWTDNFILDRFELEFQIQKKYLSARNNVAQILISTNYEQIVIHVECRQNFIPTAAKKAANDRKKMQVKLTENYLLFRTGKRLAAHYVEEAEKILEQYHVVDTTTTYHVSDILLELYRVHLFFMAGKQQQANTALTILFEEEKEWGEEIPAGVGALIYLNSLLKRDAKVTSEACHRLRSLYEKHRDTWLLLWFLLYVDKAYKSNPELRFQDIKVQFLSGCQSPVLYYEAASSWLEEPSIIKDIGKFELQVVWFCIKYQIITKEAASHFVYLAGREKDFRPLVFSVLTALYKKFKNKETLTAICGMLIKGQKREREFFTWFQEGIKETVRVTELQEFYLYTVDDEVKELYPSSILFYFQYENKLNDKRKAMLYASIIRNEKEYPEIFENYKKLITEFALEELEKGKLSRNLALIYDRILNLELLNEELIKILVTLLFRYEITCNNSFFKGVCVAHQEMEKEVCVLFSEGKAQVDLFTENAVIFLFDENGNRYFLQEQYSIYKMLHLDSILLHCYEVIDTYPKLLLHRQNELQYGKVDGDGIEVFQKIVLLTGLNQEFLLECEQILIEYFYDNFRGEELEKLLIQMDFSLLSHSFRIRMMELLLLRDLHHLVFAMIQKYGFEGIAEKRLLRICVCLIPEAKEEHIELLTKTAFAAFCKNKYEIETLKFLEIHYKGSTDSMFELWRIIKETDLEILHLEERLLIQVLFVENHIRDAVSLVRSYYNHGVNKKIIRAALSYYAYKYLVYDYLYDTDLFDMMKKESSHEENELYILALLKFYSTQKQRSDTDHNFIEFHLDKMEQKDIILPFFKDFGNTMRAPRDMYDKYYIEYRTDPSAKVVLHYYYDGCSVDGSFLVEEMRNVCYGIFVKEVLLFYNESFQYFIEEERNGITNLMESKEIQEKPEFSEEEDTKYHHLNLVITAKEMNEDVTVIELLEHYIKTDYAIDHLFHFAND